MFHQRLCLLKTPTQRAPKESQGGVFRRVSAADSPGVGIPRLCGAHWRVRLLQLRMPFSQAHQRRTKIYSFLDLMDLSLYQETYELPKEISFLLNALLILSARSLKVHQNCDSVIVQLFVKHILCMLECKIPEDSERVYSPHCHHSTT